MRTRAINIRGPVTPQQQNLLRPDARVHEAASSGRRLGGWDAPAVSPNQAAIADIDILRRRSRAAIRNNPWINRGVAADVANEIGTGITPRSRAPDPDMREALRELWNDWAPVADAAGVMDVYGVQYQAARARREAGEVFLRLRQRRPSDGLPVPMQVQVVEADLCPAGYHTTAPSGNEIQSGIELDAIGRRVAYWMYRKHPDDGGNLADMVRVPADQVIHHFIPLRPGQLRGEPVTTQALVRAYQFDQYDDAELERKKTRADYTGVIKKPDYGEGDFKYDPFTGEQLSEDEGGAPVMDTQPGTFPSLLPGEDVTLFNGDDTGTGYKDFTRQQLLGIAAGLGIPYEVLSGDYSAINDRLWRAIVNQYRRDLEQATNLFTIQQVCRGIWVAFVDKAILAGEIDAPDYERRRREYIRAEFKTQAWPYIHPLQDAQAMQLIKKEGFNSRQALVAERGRDVEEVDQQRAEDQQREQDLGLTEDKNG